MRRLPHRCLFLAVPSLLLLACMALAQRPSHEFDADDTPPKDIAKRLNAPRTRTPNLDSEFLRKLLQNLPQDIDPKTFDDATIRRFLDNNPEFRDPKNLERLRDLFKDQVGERPDKKDPNIDWANLQDRLKRIEDFRKNQKVVDPIPPDLKKDQPDPMPRPQPEKPPPPPKKKPDKQFEELTKWARNLGDSPAMRDVAKDFNKMIGKTGNGKGPDFLGDLEKEWKGLTGSSLKGDDKKGNSPDLKDLASGLKLPDLSGSGGGSSSKPPSSSSSGSGSSSPPSYSPSSSSSSSRFTGFGGGDSWAPVIMLVLLAVGGVLFWFFYIRKRQEPEIEEDASKRLWPAPPVDINTREDVVKAFEYLSVSKCGEEAVNWHHHQIANRMGGKEPDRQEAAARLAYLYEKARYAPANELFTDTDLAEARARLQQLGGASAV